MSGGDRVSGVEGSGGRFRGVAGTGEWDVSQTAKSRTYCSRGRWHDDIVVNLRCFDSSRRARWRRQ